MPRLVALVLILLGPAALAQVPQGGATTSPVGPADVAPVVGDSALTDAGWTSYIPYSRTRPPSEAEQAVIETVRGEGVHVVHLWAPWCGNSQAAFETGWYEVLERHPEVTFTFITVRNDGEDGAETLRRYGIPETAAVLAHPSAMGEEVSFLGQPVSWTPATWVFNRGGRLAYAFNYGEVSAEMLETAIQHAQSEWTHD